jgi:hypothetical protein
MCRQRTVVREKNKHFLLKNFLAIRLFHALGAPRKIAVVK